MSGNLHSQRKLCKFHRTGNFNFRTVIARKMVTQAMCRQLSGICNYKLSGLQEGDEYPA